MSFKPFRAICFVALALLTGPSILCSEDKAAGQPYRQMDYGPSLHWTYQVAGDHIVYKGIAVQVDDAPGGIGKGHAWMVFDHDTLSMAAAWVTPEGSDKAPFIDWKGVAFDSSHSSHPTIVGKTIFVNRPGPGYANPADGSFADLRYVSPVDHKMYGPIPRDWAHFQGVYRSGHKVVIAYTVGKTSVLELPGYDSSANVFSRTFYIEKNAKSLLLRVAPEATSVTVAGIPSSSLIKNSGSWFLKVPASTKPLRFKLLLSDTAPTVTATKGSAKIEEIELLCRQ